MNEKNLQDYEHIRSGGAGSFEQKHGLIAVWGKEAIPFLDGMITNDMKTLEDGQQMITAFPNAQGRLLAVVWVIRRGDRYFFETEEASREKVFNNLFRFTFAGDFFVEDVSEKYRFIQVWNFDTVAPDSVLRVTSPGFTTWAVPDEEWVSFCHNITDRPYVQISEDAYETLRIESGIPKYGVDIDETTIVPELGLEGLISYNKGCYIGQEIIARIHFRGHVAKQLIGLLSEPGAVATGFLPGGELRSLDGKNAGRITSVTFSPKLGKNIALAYVRYDHLAIGTQLNAGDFAVEVTNLPFVPRIELEY